MSYLSPHHLSADGQSQQQLHHQQQLSSMSSMASPNPSSPPPPPAAPSTTTTKKIYHDFTMEDAEVIGGLCRLQDCVRPTSPRSQMEREKRIRREIANSNERRRMQSINTGFQALKSLIPHTDGEKLSKAAILQQTSEYILQLEKEKAKLHHQNALLLRKLGSIVGANNPQLTQWASDDGHGDRAPSPPPNKWRKVAGNAAAATSSAPSTNAPAAAAPTAENNEVADSSDEGVGGLTPEANNQRVPASQAGTPEVIHQQTAAIDNMKRDINELTKLLDCERTTSKTLRQLLEERTRDQSSQQLQQLQQQPMKSISIIDASLKAANIINNNTLGVAPPSTILLAPSPIVTNASSTSLTSHSKPASSGSLMTVSRPASSSSSSSSSAVNVVFSNSASTPRAIKPAQILTIAGQTQQLHTQQQQNAPRLTSTMVAPIAPAPKGHQRISAHPTAIGGIKFATPNNVSPIAVALKQQQPLDLDGNSKSILMTSPPPPAPPASGTLPYGLTASGGAVHFVSSHQPQQLQQQQHQAQTSSSQGQQGAATHMIIPISIANVASQLQQISPVAAAASGLTNNNATIYLTNQLQSHALSAGTSSAAGLKVEVKQEPSGSVLTSPEAATAILRHQIQQQQQQQHRQQLLSPTAASLSQQLSNSGGVTAAILPAGNNTTLLLQATQAALDRISGQHQHQQQQSQQQQLPASALLSPVTLNQASSASTTIFNTSSAAALPRVLALPVQSAVAPASQQQQQQQHPLASYASAVQSSDGTIELLLSSSNNQLLQHYQQQHKAQQQQQQQIHQNTSSLSSQMQLVATQGGGLSVLTSQPKQTVEAAALSPISPPLPYTQQQQQQQHQHRAHQPDLPQRVERVLSPPPAHNSSPQQQQQQQQYIQQQQRLSPALSPPGSMNSPSIHSALPPPPPPSQLASSPSNIFAAATLTAAADESGAHLHKVSSGLETIFEAIHHVEGTACQGCAHMHHNSSSDDHDHHPSHSHTHSPICPEVSSYSSAVAKLRQQPSPTTPLDARAFQHLQQCYTDSTMAASSAALASPSHPPPASPSHPPPESPYDLQSSVTSATSRKRSRISDEAEDLQQQRRQRPSSSSLSSSTISPASSFTSSLVTRTSTANQQLASSSSFASTNSNQALLSTATTYSTVSSSLYTPTSAVASTSSLSSMNSSHQKAPLRHPKKDMRARTLILDQDPS